MRLHWHRRDLRLADNPGVTVDGDPVVGLFVFDPAVLSHAAPPRTAFLLDALSSLKTAYAEEGGELLLARGNPKTIVPAVAESLEVSSVSWGEDYSGVARERDAAVRTQLAELDIDRKTVHEAVHHEPGTITTNKGDPYKVFTYFSKKWHKREKAPPAELSTAFSAVGSEHIDESALRGGVLLDSVPTLAALDFSEPEATIPPAGTDHARERLAEFCEADIYQYGERRDYPAAGCTSRLSVALKYGTIGIREVYARTDDAIADAETETERDSVREFQDQLAWREFYIQVLWDRPDVVTANYKEYQNPIQWRESPEAVAAWKAGETGYPIVDAGMRQLRAEAFMHNRVRMIVASFLTKDLLVDWRVGYDWFRERLVDHDTANDNGGWQWAASTGTDAQPYFRIFNPMTQGERYDPDAEYIKRYVPELAGVPATVIHSWDELDAGTRRMHAPEYPGPIVDHSDRREQALSMFEHARGDS